MNARIALFVLASSGFHVDSVATCTFSKVALSVSKLHSRSASDVTLGIFSPLRPLGAHFGLPLTSFEPDAFSLATAFSLVTALARPLVFGNSHPARRAALPAFPWRPSYAGLCVARFRPYGVPTATIVTNVTTQTLPAFKGYSPVARLAAVASRRPRAPLTARFSVAVLNSDGVTITTAV